MQYDLRNAIFERLQRLDFARHDELPTGQLVSRASSDLGLIQGLLSFTPIMIGNLVMTVVSLVVMLFLSPLLTLVAVLCLPALLVVSLKLRMTLFPATWDAQQRAGEVAGVVDEAVTGVRVVKAFGQEQRELDDLTDTAESLFRSRVRMVRLQARLQPTLSAIPALGQVAVLALGGWLAIQGEISLGTFLAFSSYLVQLVAPVRMFATLLAISQQARAGGERILEILDSNPLVTEKPDAIELAGLGGAVDFEHVTYGYLRSEPVLRDFSLHVAPGETVALVGASGSGKSTVSLLLPRFYDVQEGHVRVDGIDVRDVTLESLRRDIGVVFEDSFLFSDSVRNNIAYGRPDATDEEVERAARAAGAHEFIGALPDGYATVVGERGLTLSGGQRQRVAIARATAHRPRGPHPRRRDVVGRRPHGGADPRDPARGHGRADDDRRRPPPLDAAASPNASCSSTGAGSSTRAPTRSCSRRSALYRDLLAGPRRGDRGPRSRPWRRWRARPRVRTGTRPATASRPPCGHATSWPRARARSPPPAPRPHRAAGWRRGRGRTTAAGWRCAPRRSCWRPSTSSPRPTPSRGSTSWPRPAPTTTSRCGASSARTGARSASGSASS